MSFSNSVFFHKWYDASLTNFFLFKYCFPFMCCCRDEPMFDSSYKLFCERVSRQRLLVNNEVLRMGQLTKAFNDMVKANKSVDAPNYR